MKAHKKYIYYNRIPIINNYAHVVVVVLSIWITPHLSFMWVFVRAQRSIGLTVPRRTNNMLRYTHLDSPAYIELGCFPKFCIIVAKLHLCVPIYTHAFFFIAYCEMTRDVPTYTERH